MDKRRTHGGPFVKLAWKVGVGVGRGDILSSRCHCLSAAPLPRLRQTNNKKDAGGLIKDKRLKSLKVCPSNSHPVCL